MTDGEGDLEENVAYDVLGKVQEIIFIRVAILIFDEQNVLLEYNY